MNKAQWKAIHEFCEEFGCTSKELLNELKENGTVAKNARLEDLAQYVSDTSYNAMIEFLGENI